MRERSRTEREDPISTFADCWVAPLPSCSLPWPPLNVHRLDVAISGSYVPYQKDEVMYDVVTPNFQKVRDGGGIVNNPYTKTTTIWERDKILYEEVAIDGKYILCSGKSTLVYRSGGRFGPGTLSPVTYLGTAYPATPSLDVDRVKRLAMSQAWAKANVTEVASLPALAEAEKSITAVASVMKRLWKFLKALKRLDVQGVLSELTPRQLGERWMEARYAIRPLVYDMHGVVNAIIGKPVPPVRWTFRSGANDSASVADVYNCYTRAGYWKLYANRKTEAIVSCRSGVLTAVERIHEASAWGLDQPVLALWELVPFSFVVDWFLNVGTVLASWSPSTGLKPLASWLTTKVVVKQTLATSHFVDLLTGTPTYPLVQRSLALVGGYNHKTTVTTSREPDPSRPVLPSFKIRLDAAKLLDLTLMCRSVKPPTAHGGH